MDWTTNVDQISDGQDVSAAVINSPLSALTARTQYLYEQLNGANNERSTLLAFGQAIASGSGITGPAVVYYDGESTETAGLKLADPKITNLAQHPFFRGANSAHVFGVVTEITGTTATVCLQGLHEAENLIADLLDVPNATFVCGPLYLSAVQLGKLTPTPNGLAIFVAYAKSRTELYINPSQESLSELFWSFRYSVLDRPAATVGFDGASWSQGAHEPTKVGWVIATEKLEAPSLEALFPGVQPKYFYQLPDPATIEAYNPELTDAEKAAAINLRLALPARPNSFSFLTVNGVVYSPKVSPEDKGSYALNELGLWWFPESSYDTDADDGEFDQPWGKDLPYAIEVDTARCDGSGIALLGSNNQAITGLNNTPGLSVNLVIRFYPGSGGVVPSEISSGVDYVIKTLSNEFMEVALVSDPDTIIVLTTNGTAPWYIEWQPSLWRLGKGNLIHRPLMNLQFTKINPDIRQNLVTSLQTDPAVVTPAIKVTDLSTGAKAATGDLQLKLNIPVLNGWDGVAASAIGSKAVKGVRYNNTLERLELALGPVVSELRNGGGLKIESTPDGVHTLSFANAYANAVTSLEPEQARLEYFGLNSYLALDYTDTPNGFVGKFTLPDKLVYGTNNYLNLVLTLFGKSGGNASHKTMRYKFEYAVSPLNKVLSASTVSNTAVEFDLPLTNNIYAQNTSFETALGLFRIPVSSLADKATVNFRIHRRNDVSATAYTGVVGMTGVYWTLSS